MDDVRAEDHELVAEAVQRGLLTPAQAGAALAKLAARRRAGRPADVLGVLAEQGLERATLDLLEGLAVTLPGSVTPAAGTRAPSRPAPRPAP